MRFTKYPKSIERDVTPNKRRLSAAKKALKRERDKAPLFRDEIAAEQPTPEQRIATLDSNAREWLSERRRGIAKAWRECRSRLRSLPADAARSILIEWQYGYLPGSAEYLATLITSRLRGDMPGEIITEQLNKWMNGGTAYRAGHRPR